MGGEAALAYQIASGLIGNVGAYQSAGSRAESLTFMPDKSAYDAGIASYQQSIDSEYDAANKQADLLLQDFQYEASRQAEQFDDWQANVAQSFNQSGVTLDGSPLAILAHGRARKQQEIDMLGSRTASLAGLMRQKGEITANEGRAKIAALKADYIGKSAQLSALAGAEKFKDQSISGFNITNLLGSTIGLLSGSSKYGKKYFNKPTTVMSRLGGPAGRTNNGFLLDPIGSL